jgi:ubiquinone biosynthesis protein UbiJ
VNTSLSSNLLVPFETLVNRCIDQDIKLAQGIAQHSDKTLQLDITSPSVSVQVRFYPASITLLFAPDAVNETPDPSMREEAIQPDGRIRGSSLAMMRLLTERNEARSLVNPAIQISGDSEFVQSVYRLFLDMEINWQEALSRLIGDVPTHGVEQLLRSLGEFGRSTVASVRRNVDEYLHEESRVVPPRNQVEVFDRELDALRLRLDRLQARLQLLDRKLQEISDPSPE